MPIDSRLLKHLFTRPGAPTQVEIAAAHNVAQPTVAQWKAGSRSVPDDRLPAVLGTLLFGEAPAGKPSFVLARFGATGEPKWPVIRSSGEIGLPVYWDEQLARGIVMAAKELRVANVQVVSTNLPCIKQLARDLNARTRRVVEVTDAVLVLEHLQWIPQPQHFPETREEIQRRRG